MKKGRTSNYNPVIFCRNQNLLREERKVTTMEIAEPTILAAPGMVTEKKVQGWHFVEAPESHNLDSRPNTPNLPQKRREDLGEVPAFPPLPPEVQGGGGPEKRLLKRAKKGSGRVKLVGRGCRGNFNLVPARSRRGKPCAVPEKKL